MKKQLAVFGLVAGAVLAHGQANAQSAEIKVIGKILPDACQLVIGGGGVYDFGNIGADKLSKDSTTTLEAKTQTLTVTCNAAAKVAVKATDNRMGSAAGGKGDAYEFGLGKHPGGDPGYYKLALTRAISEGNTLDVLADSNNSNSWSIDSAGFTANGTSRVAFASSGSLAPEAYKNLTADLTVTPTINKLSALDLANGGVDLDGSATIELSYL
ncbi:DUF1120 domain-containing protein [Pseudomonas chlororaphis subsp. aureofaciens]|uniref:DUF1120 domain-containing protein n=1 Tax=Pseudomonas chlororaphis TaxID=587753 RepID=UPI003557D965